MSKKEIFITYSWDNEEHNEKVISFTNYLRSEGYEAEVDRMLIQTETALDFVKMMHEAMTNYDKVIIVLSKGYKEKAESFKGGVGNEYNLILKDIDSNKNKYILISFESIHEDIIPLSFKGRQIIDFTKEGSENELFAKLSQEATIEFSAVAKEKRQVVKREIPKFEINKGRIEVVNLNVRVDNSSKSGGLYNYIEYDLNLVIKNQSTRVISDYNIEVYYPTTSVDYSLEGRIEGNYKVVSYENKGKLFPEQAANVKLEMVSLKYHTVDRLIGEKFIVRVFSELGTTEAEYPLWEVLFIKDNFGQELKISSEDFKK